MDYQRFFMTREPARLRTKLRTFVALGVGPQDVMVCSFPRSGNTWMLKMLEAYFKATGTGPESIDDVEQKAADGLALNRREGLNVYKSHSVCAPFFSGNILYMYRSPVDSLVSYYHFNKRYDSSREMLGDVSVDEFCMLNLTDWAEHVSAFAAVSGESNVLPVSYEQMHADAGGCLRLALTFMGVPPDPAQVAAAVEAASFERLRKKEEASAAVASEGERFFRKGQVGSGAEELEERTAEFIRRVGTPVYEMCAAVGQLAVRKLG